MLDVLEPRTVPVLAGAFAASSLRAQVRRRTEPDWRAARAIAIVAGKEADRESLAQTLREVDPTRPLTFVSPASAGPAGNGPPALVVVDLDSMGDEGIATLRALSTCSAGIPLAALGSAMDEPTIDTVLRAGATAYVPRCYSHNQTLLALRLALEGAAHRPHFKPQPGHSAADTAGAAVPAQAGDGLRSRRLTPKQVEVLSLAAEGLSNRQIATRLRIAEGTVKLHMSAIYTKLEVDRRGEAIVMARRLQEVRAEQMRRVETGAAAVLDWLLPHVTHRRAPCGEIIFSKGDRGSGLFYIQRGSVALQEIGIELGPRQILGEISVFSPEHTRTCTARCATDVDLFCLDSEQVKSIYCLNPQFALHVVQLIAQRLLADRGRAA